MVYNKEYDSFYEISWSVYKRQFNTRTDHDIATPSHIPFTHKTAIEVLMIQVWEQKTLNTQGFEYDFESFIELTNKKTGREGEAQVSDMTSHVHGWTVEENPKE